MNCKIIVTADNSKSLLIPELNETYHSINGALNEAQHVFIKNGLEQIVSENPIRIFEMGFGTGLNALLTLNYIKNTPIYIAYKTIEKYPVDFETIKELNHPLTANLTELQTAFNEMHTSSWNQIIEITEQFTFEKIKGDLISTDIGNETYHLIYYDAFAPKVQPDLWDVVIFKKMYASLVPSGRLVTYCAQGQFKRNLREAGFIVTNVEGPVGKREMTIAIKPKVD